MVRGDRRRYINERRYNNNELIFLNNIIFRVVCLFVYTNHKGSNFGKHMAAASNGFSEAEVATEFNKSSGRRRRPANKFLLLIRDMAAACFVSQLLERFHRLYVESPSKLKKQKQLSEEYPFIKKERMKQKEKIT